MVVEHGHLPDRTRILQLEHRLLLDSEDDDVLAAYPYLHVHEMMCARTESQRTAHVPFLTASKAYSTCTLCQTRPTRTDFALGVRTWNK